jgi:imidazolonepropionase-like amidohydrolase
MSREPRFETELAEGGTNMIGKTCTTASALIAAWLASGCGPAPETTPLPGLVAFAGARLIDGTGAPAIDRAVLVARDGRIEAAGAEGTVTIPERAERVDLTGRTIIPGIINAHAHVGQTRGLASGPEQYTRENILDQLELYARYGVTAAFSMGGDGEIATAVRDEQASATLARARLFIAGPVVAATTADEARAQVAAAAALDPDWIKIRVDDNLGTAEKMPPAAYQAVIQEAHARNLKVASHLFYLEDARRLLDAGVDFIVHSVRDQEIDDETAALWKEKRVCLVPTLTREVSAFAYGSTPEFLADPFLLREVDPSVVEGLKDPARQGQVRNADRYRRALEVASANLKKLADAGVTIAFGTDSGPAGRFQGYFEHMEMELMAEAGLSPMQILVAATGDAARCTGVPDRLGTLTIGKSADFIVLEKDPLQNITHTRSIESVWISGNRVPERRSTPPTS